MRWLLIGSTAICPLSAAHAQAASEVTQGEHEDEAQLDVIVVTGTNTRRPAADALVPVQVVNQEEIIRAGATQISDILRAVPSNTGSTLYNEGGRLTGTAQFNIRGLGYSSTLVLVNGRRAGVSPLSDRSGSDFVDILQFPLAMVERVDVLKDGSSAIYGSEAVAGVVNIITRKGFEGVELSADYQHSSNDTYALNVATGWRWGGATLNLYGAYYHQSDNVRSDFDWIIARIGGNGVPGRSQLLSVNGYPGTYSLARLNGAGQPQSISGAPTIPDPGCEAAGGVFAISNAGVVDRNTCRFDFTDQVGVIPESDRAQLLAELSVELNDRLTFFNETGGAVNTNRVFLQPGSFANGLVLNSGNVFVPANHPFNFFVADASRPNGIRYVEPSAWNPATNVAVPLVANVRPEGGNVDGWLRQQNIYFRTLNGVGYDAPGGWVVNVSHLYADARFKENNPLSFNAEAINRLTLAGSYNPFATSVLSPGLVSPKDRVSVAANSPAIANELFFTSDSRRKTEQHVVDVTATGPLLRPESGTINVAIGAQFRRLSLDTEPDPIVSAGGSDRPVTEAAVHGRQRVRSAFAEIIVPYHDRVELQLAVRHDDYGGATGASTDPKVAARVKLIPGLAVRGSWGTSFQAPTLTQTSTSQARETLNDRVVLTPQGLACGAGATGRGVVVTTQGGSLEPQRSRNVNVGIDASPAKGLRFTGDYWRYSYRNLIAAGQTGQAIVNGECANGVYRADPRVQRDGTGQLFGITTSYLNVGRVLTDGFDLGATYSLPTSAGVFSLRADATYVRRFVVFGANGSRSDKVGSRNFVTNFGPMPEWRASGSLGWEQGDHRIAVAVRYTDGYRNDQSNNAPIDSFTTVDAQYGFRLRGLIGSSTQFIIGANNIFDQKPPALRRNDASGTLISGTNSDIDRPGYDALAGADIRGRILYARISQEF